MTETPAASVPDKGVIARAIGMITSPGATYQSVVANPRPAGILFLVCLVISLATALPQFTERGRQAALDMQVQQTERFIQVSPEMYSQMEARSHYNGYITFVATFVALPIFTLIFGAIYWVVFNAIMGGTATFKQVLAVLTHSQVPSALGAIVAAPIQLATSKISTAGPFNLGVLFPMLEPNSPMSNFLGSIGLFQVWGIVVCAIGFGVLYRRKAGTIAVVLLAIFLAFMALFAYLPSFFGR